MIKLLTNKITVTAVLIIWASAVSYQVFFSASGGGEKTASSKFQKRGMSARSMQRSGSGMPSKPSSRPSSMKSKYAAVAKGKLDVDGGVINVASRRGGTFREVYAKEGDRVKAGQILAKQEDDQEQISLKSARTSIASAKTSLKSAMLQLTIAKRELARLKPLLEIDAVSQIEYDRKKDDVARLAISLESQKVAVDRAKIGLETAEFNLEQRIVRAPLAGRIIEAQARPGVGASSLQVSTAFVLMPDTQRIIRADLDEAFVGQVTVGQMAIVSPDARPNEIYKGQVIRVGEIFGRRTTQNNARGGSANDHVIEVVVGLGKDVEMLIGQRVLVRFQKQSNIKGDKNAQ